MAQTPPRKMSSKEILEEALKAREQFLKEQPHLRAFQDEIDRIMEKTAGFENRVSVLSFMIQTKLCELRDSIADLNSTAFKIEGFLKGKVENADKVLDYSPDSSGYLN